MFVQHSYGVSGVVTCRAQLNPLLPFQMGLVFPLHFIVARLRKGGSTAEGGLPCHISHVDVLAGLADVAVRFEASHAECDASAYNDSIAGNCA